MANCENKVAAAYSIPRGPRTVEDRRMTLEIQCTMRAEYSTQLRGVGKGKKREGAEVKTFSLCDNHSTLFQEIDRELRSEGWASALTPEKPTRIW